MAKSQIVDIFNGEYITIWRDEDCIFFNTPFATLNLSEEDWEAFKKDIEKIGEL